MNFRSALLIHASRRSSVRTLHLAINVAVVLQDIEEELLWALDEIMRKTSRQERYFVHKGITDFLIIYSQKVKSELVIRM